MSCRSVLGQLLSSIAVSFGAASSLSDGRCATWSSLRESVIRNHLRMGTSEDFGGNHMLSWGTEEGGGVQSSSTEYQGGTVESGLPMKRVGLLEHYRALWGDQVKIYCNTNKSSEEAPLPDNKWPVPDKCKWRVSFFVQATYQIKTESKPFCYCSSGVSLYARRSFLLDPDTDRFYACMYTSESWVSIPQVFLLFL